MPVPMSNTVVMLLFDLFNTFQLTVQFWHVNPKILIINRLTYLAENQKQKTLSF